MYALGNVEKFVCGEANGLAVLLFVSLLFSA